MSLGTTTRRGSVRTAVLTLVLFGIVALSSLLGVVRHLGLQVSDTFFRVAPAPHEHSQVVIVSIDDESLRQYGRWPWSRTLLARLANNLRRAGAEVVGLDILLSESQTPAADLELSQSLLGSNAVIVDKIGTLPDGPRWIEPIPELSRAAKIGHAQAVLDVDGVCRRFPASELNVDGIRWAFAVEVARQINPPKTDTFLAAYGIRPQSSVLTVVKPVLIPIAYRSDPFLRISASKALQGELPDLNGRPVLVGFGSTEIADRLSTPISGELPTPGIDVHAHILDSVLSGRMLHESPLWASAILLALTCLGLMELLQRWQGWKAIAVTLIAGASIYLGCLLIFASASLILPVGAMLSAVVLAPMIAYVSEFIIIERAITAQMREMENWLALRGIEAPRVTEGVLSWRLELLRQLQTELGSLYELHKTLLETTQSAVVIFDQDGNHLLHNRRFSELFSSTAGWNLSLQRFREILWPDGASRTAVTEWGEEGEVAAGGESHTIRIAPIPSTTLTPRGGTLVTLTSLKMREERDRARGESLSFVTHELRTPLTAIQGFAEIMIQYPGSPSCAKAPETILRESKRLLALISTYLDVLRLDAGARSIASEPVALREVVQQVLEILEPLAGAARMRLRYDGDLSATLIGDRGLIAGAVLNLVSNAIKYGRAETDIIVRTCRQDSEMVISVQNQGEPISSDDLSRLFDPFYRSGRAEARPGWGLGLAFVKRIAEKHAGSVRAESGASGTTFEIHLPAQGLTAAKGAA